MLGSIIIQFIVLAIVAVATWVVIFKTSGGNYKAAGWIFGIMVFVGMVALPGRSLFVEGNPLTLTEIDIGTSKRAILRVVDGPDVILSDGEWNKIWRLDRFNVQMSDSTLHLDNFIGQYVEMRPVYTNGKCRAVITPLE